MFEQIVSVLNKVSDSIQKIAYDNSCGWLRFCVDTPTAAANLFSMNSPRPDLAIQGLISIFLVDQGVK